VLQSDGYQTLSAADGQEALELFQERSGDIRALILDVRMPRKTGQEVLQEVRERAPHIPVLMMSGFDTTENHRAIQPTAYLRKPFSVHQLLSELRLALESADACESAGPACDGETTHS
jgi:DNA-binding response OmpR family regulator